MTNPASSKPTAVVSAKQSNEGGLKLRAAVRSKRSH